MKSDLSGEALEGSDNPVTVRITLPDKAQRDLTISAAEAEALSERGRAVDLSWARRVKDFVTRNGWKALTAAVALWFASIVIPALVQQWADRQKELELKSTLVTQMSDSVSDTITGSSLIQENLTPEAVARKRAYTRLQEVEESAKMGDGNDERTTPSEQRKIDAAQTRLDAALAAESRAEQVLFNTTRNQWIKTAASFEARLATYFGDGDLPDAWTAYHPIILDRVELATSIRGQARQDVESRVVTFLCGSFLGERPDYKSQRMEDICATKRIPTGELFPSVAVGDELLRRRVVLLRKIRDANADGYSTGLSDFLRAVTPLGAF